MQPDDERQSNGRKSTYAIAVVVIAGRGPDGRAAPHRRRRPRHPLTTLRIAEQGNERTKPSTSTQAADEQIAELIDSSQRSIRPR